MLMASVQPRILIFAHDGKGLGHLRRLGRIAAALQGDCAVLVVTGHRDASWLVPEACEFIHIPSLDSLDSLTSHNWGRSPFWKDASVKGRQLRSAVIDSVVKEFAPDAILVDYLPMGKNGEIYHLIEQKVRAKCYLILRGVLDEQQRVQAVFFNPRVRHLMEHRYDRILVTADNRIVDVASEYGFSTSISSKVFYTGYITDPISDAVRVQARLQRGIAQRRKWVVCSAGGGMEGEELVEHVIGAVDQFADVYFDIILGPRSRSHICPEVASRKQRIQVRKFDPALPILHAAADVVVCRGGYNSLLECITGHGRVIVMPLKGHAEQHSHVARLAQFHPISVVHDFDGLQRELYRALRLERFEITSKALNVEGVSNCQKVIARDLKIAR
jgi:predicted glycosyltransferase